MAATNTVNAKLQQTLNEIKTAQEADLSAIKEALAKIQKQVDIIATQQGETVGKINDLATRAATASKGGSKKPPANQRRLTDADGNPVSSSDWFKFQWLTNYEEFKGKYLLSRHLKALDEFQKSEKCAGMSGDKLTTEKMNFFWKHFVVPSNNEHCDKELLKKILADYGVFKEKILAEKAAAGAAEAAPSPVKGKSTPASPAAASPKKKAAANKKPAVVAPPPEPEEEAPAEDEAPADEVAEAGEEEAGDE